MLFGCVSTNTSHSYQEDIRRTVREHLGEFAKCYKTYLGKTNRETPANGKVVLHWFTNTEGRVEFADVKSDAIKSNSLNECLLATLKVIRFPTSPDDKDTITEISYPFVFNQEDAQKQKAQGNP